MNQEFDRWKSRSGTTWVLKLFKKHHTLLNSMMWSYIPTESYCNYLYRQNSKTKTFSTTCTLFHASGPDAHRIDDKLEDWKDSYQEFDNWTRLNALVALLSYFEVYLASVVTRALESDPGLKFKTTRVIDGMQIIKFNSVSSFNFRSEVEQITKGEWHQRIASFKQIFGSVPQIIVDNIKQLERMRKLRNNVAHAFGREIEKAQERGLLDILEIDRLSLQTLKEYMEIINDIVYEIDHQLLSNHIGSYEVLFYYHKINPQLSIHNKATSLRKELNKIGINGTCNDVYCTELINYYDSL